MLVAVATGSSTPAGRRGPRSGAAGSGSRRTCRCRRLVKGVVLVVVQEPHQAGRRGWGQAELAASKRHAGDAPAVRWGRRPCLWSRGAVPGASAGLLTAVYREGDGTSGEDGHQDRVLEHA